MVDAKNTVCESLVQTLWITKVGSCTCLLRFHGDDCSIFMSLKTKTLESLSIQILPLRQRQRPLMQRQRQLLCDSVSCWMSWRMMADGEWRMADVSHDNLDLFWLDLKAFNLFPQCFYQVLVQCMPPVPHKCGDFVHREILPHEEKSRGMSRNEESRNCCFLCCLAA